MQNKFSFRIMSLFFMANLLAGNIGMLASYPPASAGTATVTFTPVADAYVISTSASTNYGTGTTLRVDGSPVTNSYLRFVVSGLNGATIQSAS
jgi:hypothetical protein